MKVQLVPVTQERMFYIAANLRARDAQEIFCTRWTEDPAALTDEMMYVVGRPTSMSVIATFNGFPAAALGAAEPWPGLWEVWAFGTDDFDHVAFTLTKYTRRVLLPALLQRGVRRMQCRSMVGHTKAHDWLRSFGARQDDERALKGWGKNGEDFIMFELHREDLLKRYTEAA